VTKVKQSLRAGEGLRPKGGAAVAETGVFGGITIEGEKAQVRGDGSGRKDVHRLQSEKIKYPLTCRIEGRRLQLTKAAEGSKLPPKHGRENPFSSTPHREQ